MNPDFTPLTGLLGGALIGLAAVLLLIANGRIAGVSGIVGGLLARVPGDAGWRAAFVLGSYRATAPCTRSSRPCSAGSSCTTG